MNHRDQVARLLAVVDVVRADAFSWFGEAVPVATLDAGAVQPQAALVDALAEHLYQNFYTPGAPVRFPRSNTVATASVSGVQLQQQLDRANASSGHVQRDWCIAAIDGEQLQLTRRELTVRMPAAGCRPLQGQDFVPGDRVAVEAPSARPWRSPGYYMVIGDNVAGRDNAASIVRIYWNVTGEGRVPLLQSLTRHLNALQRVFWFKVATGAESARCDQAVLYLYRRDLVAVWAVLQDVYRGIRGELRRAVPALTHRLAAGVGLAEDPANGESFGSDRCALLAQCIATQTVDNPDRVGAVATHFSRHGVDLARPYQAQNSASLDDLAFEPPAVAVPGQGAASDLVRGRDQALDCAQAIAAELQHSAVWHADRCSWLGHQLSAGCCGGVHDSVPVAPLAADLYSGIGGVGWFLLEIARVSEAPGVIATANAAFRQAAHLLHIQPPDLGLYSGQLGTAIAMLRAADTLDEARLKRAARRWLMRSLGQATSTNGFDVISGLAGRALGLTLFGRSSGDDCCIDAGRRCADALLASAQRSPDGLCWRDDQNPAPLLGYAHGTAGAAHALLEVFAATGETRYRAAAERAIAYEQVRFDPQVQDWPDLRRRGAFAHLPLPTRPQFSATWCHGAPGIALSRLRAFDLLGDAQYQAQAEAALHAVEKGLAATLETGIDDFSLCHGVAGSMEVLIEAGQGIDTCLSAAERGSADYLRGSRWPSGLIHGSSPSLMLGLAGIGHAYLRLYEPTAASVLALATRVQDPMKRPVPLDERALASNRC